MENTRIGAVLRRVRKAINEFRSPVVTQISRSHDPFQVLISCILSLRTRDEVTGAASERLFRLAGTPEGLMTLNPRSIEKAIYPVAFFRNKTRCLQNLCRDLVLRYEGKVPDTLEELLTLKGVGRKTANLTIILGHRKPGICVDTHVHRISNRWGYVQTKSPDETEMALREKLPKRYWMEYNDLLVSFGQNICKPVSPHCSRCAVHSWCPKTGVNRHR